jgi:hypothetical protein
VTHHHPEDDHRPQKGRPRPVTPSNGRAVSLGFDFGPHRGGKLVGKFRMAAGVTKGGMTDDRRALFFRDLERRLSFL